MAEPATFSAWHQTRPQMDAAVPDQSGWSPSRWRARTKMRAMARTMNPIHESTSCAVAACAEISPRTLSERLRVLEDEGIVERRSYPVSPPRVEYELTEKGAALLPIIDAMREFGHDWLPCRH